MNMTPLQHLVFDLFLIVFCSVSMNALDKAMEKYSSVILQGLYIIFGVVLIYCWVHLPFAAYKSILTHIA